MSKRFVLTTGLLATLVAFAFYYCKRSTSAPTPRAEAHTMPRNLARGAPAHPPQPNTARVVEPEPEPVALLGNAQIGVESVERVRKSLEIYKETMVYPPWSRPIDDATKHLLEWNKPWPIGQPFAADKDRREIRVDASLDKLFAGTGEPFTATVTIKYEHPPNEPVVPEQLSGRVQYLDGEWKLAEEVTFAKVGDRYIATFTPSTIPALAAKPREAQLLVHVQMGELFPKELPIPFQYSATDSFTVEGLAGDHVTADGSLEVALDVNVKHLAPTLVQAFLFDADGKRGISTYSEYFRPTAIGRQQVPIKFFGKSIYESRIGGRYRVQSLNGHVKVPGAMPPEVFWARSDQLPPLLTARPYSSGQFTRDAWTSTEKDAKIKQYEDLIRDLGGSP